MIYMVFGRPSPLYRQRLWRHFCVAFTQNFQRRRDKPAARRPLYWLMKQQFWWNAILPKSCAFMMQPRAMSICASSAGCKKGLKTSWKIASCHFEDEKKQCKGSVLQADSAVCINPLWHSKLFLRIARHRVALTTWYHRHEGFGVCNTTVRATGEAIMKNFKIAQLRETAKETLSAGLIFFWLGALHFTPSFRGFDVLSHIFRLFFWILHGFRHQLTPLNVKISQCG